MSIILASASPRRRELMSLITGDFGVVVSQADETLPEGLGHSEAVELLAAKKARSVALQYPQSVVIGADTIVAVGGERLGKPADDADAERMLRLLSGRWHQVYTGVCVTVGGRETIFSDAARVLFCEMADGEISEYVKSGECRDKAGGYAIQGLGARYVSRIDGSYHTVVGLPVSSLYQVLKGMGALPSPAAGLQ